MATTQAKVIKIGNSYGVRLSRAHLKAVDVRLGETLEFDMRKPSKPDKAKALAALRQLAKTKGSLAHIPDPAAWQRQLRGEWDEREKRELDIT